MSSAKDDPDVLEACVAQLGPDVAHHAENAFVVEGVAMARDLAVPPEAASAIARMLKIERLLGPSRHVSGSASHLDVYRIGPPGPLRSVPVDACTYRALYTRAERLYPEPFSYGSFEDVEGARHQRCTTSLTPAEADAWMRAHVLPRDSFGDPRHRDHCVPTPWGTRMADERDRALDTWWTLLREGLVGAGSVTVHSFTDERNENTEYGVHLLVGHVWAIFVLRRWVL